MQTLAVELLLIAEERAKAEGFAEAFKLAVVGSDPVRWTSQMFPQWVGQEAQEPQQQVEVNEDLDMAAIKGEVAFSEEMDPEEIRRTLEEMTSPQEKNGTLDWSDLGGEGWEEEQW